MSFESLPTESDGTDSRFALFEHSPRATTLLSFLFQYWWRGRAWFHVKTIQSLGMAVSSRLRHGYSPGWFQNLFSISNLCGQSALTQSQETSEFSSSDSHVRTLLEEFEDHVTPERCVTWGRVSIDSKCEHILRAHSMLCLLARMYTSIHSSHALTRLHDSQAPWPDSFRFAFVRKTRVAHLSDPNTEHTRIPQWNVPCKLTRTRPNTDERFWHKCTYDALHRLQVCAWCVGKWEEERRDIGLLVWYVAWHAVLHGTRWHPVDRCGIVCCRNVSVVHGGVVSLRWWWWWRELRQ